MLELLRRHVHVSHFFPVHIFHTPPKRIPHHSLYNVCFPPLMLDRSRVGTSCLSRL